MNIRILYSKKAEKFLKKNSDIINEDEVDRLLSLSARVIFNKEKLNIDIKKIKGSKLHLFRVRKGKIRIIFTIVKNEIVILNVDDIGFRGDIY